MSSLFAGRPLHAQELQCNVTVSGVQNLPSSVRDLLKDFESDVERYLNGNKYTNEDMLGDRIVCSMDIFLKSSPGDNRYIAQVFVGSQRPIYANDEPTKRTSPVVRILDDKWEFNYMPGQRMRQDDFSFDPLTDFLDFYAYIIIGSDLETYQPGAGDQYFRKAVNICIQGSNSSVSGGEYQFKATGYNRNGFSEELTNSKYTPLREAITSYYFDGLDELGTDELQGLGAMLKAIATIDQVRRTQNPISILAKQFFNVKNREIADAFSRYPDPFVYDKLGEYDAEHLSVYRERRSR